MLGSPSNGAPRIKERSRLLWRCLDLLLLCDCVSARRSGDCRRAEGLCTGDFALEVPFNGAARPDKVCECSPPRRAEGLRREVGLVLRRRAWRGLDEAVLPVSA